MTARGTVRIVVMGVSGCGKTTVGRALAARLDLPFKDGDDLHPAANIAKMRAGRPLSDRDRAPWLAAVAGWLVATAESDGGGVIACSALRRRYRRRLAKEAGAAFLFLDPPERVLRRRVAARRHGFMPATLLGSQRRALERPGAGERMLRVGTAALPRIVDRAVAWARRL